MPGLYGREGPAALVNSFGRMAFFSAAAEAQIRSRLQSRTRVCGIIEPPRLSYKPGQVRTLWLLDRSRSGLGSSRRWRSRVDGRLPRRRGRCGAAFFVVQLDDVLGDINRIGRPENGQRVADVEDDGEALFESILVDHSEDLLFEPADDLVLLLLELVLGVLHVAVEGLRFLIDGPIQIVLGGIAQRVGALLKLVLESVDLVLFALQLFALRRGFRVQIRSGLLAFLGASNGALNVDDADLLLLCVP